MATNTHTMTSRTRQSTPQSSQVTLELPGLSSSRAAQASKERWKLDLAHLLRFARKRFADIAWVVEEGGEEEIWAHKAIIYARASGQFQLKYLSQTTPSPHSRLPVLPSNSSLSVGPYSNSNSLRSTTPQSAPRPVRPTSPGQATLASFVGSARQVARLNGTDPTLFQSILEALYTGNGLSEVFAFLFDDHTAGDNLESRTLKLRKDLLYMWRSKLYADCQIVLVNQQDLDQRSPNTQVIEEEAVFSAHRAVLCSRSPYFSSLLLDPYADSDNRIFTLASPPFTPASLHFSLGYLYCGTLDFSNRNFDLTTAMQIWRSAQYLGLDLLREEVEAKIADMCHCFTDLCKACVSRIGRVYAFSLAPDVNSVRLEKAAEPFVVRHFSSIWNKAIGELHYGAQTHLVDLVCLSIDPNTIIDAIRGSKKLKEKLVYERSDWSDHLLSMLEPVDEQIGVILQKKLPAVITSKGFSDLLVGFGFSNDVLERALVTLVEKLTEETAAEAYQVLVGQVLLREDGLPMDARVIVEDAKRGILKFLKSHWTNVRVMNGFDPLENWALKEISDEIDVPVDDLLLSTNVVEPIRTRTGLKMASTVASKVAAFEENRSISAASLRASVLGRNASRRQTQAPQPLSNTSAKSSSSTISTIITHRTRNTTRSQHTPSTSTTPGSKPVPSRQRSSESTSSVASARGLSRATGSVKGTSTDRRRPSVISPTNPSPPLPSSTSSKSEPATSSTKSTTHRALSNNKSPVIPPLPPLPSSSTSSKTQTKTSNAPPPITPTSLPSSSPRVAANRTLSNISRTRKPSDINTNIAGPRSTDENDRTLRTPRSRTLTGASGSSVRSSAQSAVSNARKVVSSRPPVVKRAPSSISMKSDTSTTTIGAQRATRQSIISFKSPPISDAPLAGPTTRKKAMAGATLTPQKPPERLRTTSATARTSAASSLRPTVPLTKQNRPSSVTSVRTTASARISDRNKALSSKTLNSATGKTNEAVSSSRATPSTPLISKGKTTTAHSMNRVRSALPALENSSPTVRTRKISTKPSISMRSVRARKTTLPSSAPVAKEESDQDLTEVIADVTASTEISETYTDQSNSSGISTSTIRSPPIMSEDRKPSYSLPSNQIIVTPSSTQTIQNRGMGSNQPMKPPGTTLLIGIPCVVATTTTLEDGMVQPTKFRAVVKYLGETYFGAGQWVGVEVAEKEEMINKEWNDGSVEGIRYFELGQESKESKLRLFRNLSVTPSGERRPEMSEKMKMNGSVGSGGEESSHGSLNSLRPSLISKTSSGFNNRVIGINGYEEKLTRGLFVRPQEVIFVF